MTRHASRSRDNEAGMTRHCEERSDEAIQIEAVVLDCFAFGSQ
jgi:hypothetical protein